MRVSDTDVARVCEVLFQARKPRAVSWEEGVDAAYNWPASVEGRRPHRPLGCDTQLYASHRGYGLHGWGRARFTEVDDDRDRLFVRYTGEFTESQGLITPEERALAASVHDSWAALGFDSA